MSPIIPSTTSRKVAPIKIHTGNLIPSNCCLVPCTKPPCPNLLWGVMKCCYFVTINRKAFCLPCRYPNVGIGTCKQRYTYRNDNAETVDFHFLLLSKVFKRTRLIETTNQMSIVSSHFFCKQLYICGNITSAVQELCTRKRITQKKR